MNHLTLDGVIQGPGRAGEDASGGFRHSGWASRAGGDPALGAGMRERMSPGFSWLFGRRSYEDVLRHGNSVGGPMADGLNGALKYVASSSPQTDLPWPNSVPLTGDVALKVARLRDDTKTRSRDYGQRPAGPDLDARVTSSISCCCSSTPLCWAPARN